MIVTALKNVSDRYSRTGDIYEDEADFALMCESCFGEPPELTLNADGSYSDDLGVVLVPVVAEQDDCGFIEVTR